MDERRAEFIDTMSLKYDNTADARECAVRRESGAAETDRQAFGKGMRDGIPIGLGYLAVSFSLGIVARNVGLTPFQAFLASLLCNASAGEYAGFTSIC